MLNAEQNEVQREIEDMILDINHGIKNRSSEIKVKSGDRNSRILAVQITDNGTPFNLSNMTARLYVLKPDGTKVFADAVITIPEFGNLTVTLTEQMLAAPGVAKCEFVLTGADDSLLSTAVFKITVQESVNDRNAIQSTDEFCALLNAIDTVDGLDNRITILNGDLTQTKNQLSSAFEDVNNELTSLFELNPGKHGVTFDGVTDDSDALQKFFDNDFVSGNIIFPQNKVLYLTKPITLKRSNLTIDLNGCTIKWGNINSYDEALERNVGVFQFEGETVADFGAIVGFSNYDETNIEHGGRVVSVVEVESTTGLNPNDFVKVYVKTSNTQSIDTLSPYVILLTKVLRVEQDRIWVEYNTPYDFGTNYVFSQLRKYNPIHNVTIKNGYFVDLNDWNYKVESQAGIPTSVLNKCVCFINATGVSNCRFDNISARNTTNPVVKVSLGYDIVVNDLYVDRPSITCGGRGYGVQLENVIYGKVNNVYGNYVRHCVDFSGCYFSEMKNVRGNYTFGSSFMTHGCYDHDLLFENCYGSMSLGAGLAYGKCSINVTVKNSIISQLGHSYAYGLKIEDSKVLIVSSDFSSETELWQNATFVNSDVDVLGGFYSASNRFDGKDKSLRFLNCNVNLLNFGKNTTQTFRGFDLILFDGGKLVNETNMVNKSNLTVNIGGVNRFNLNGTYIESVYFELASNTSTFLTATNINVSSKLKESDVYALFNIQSGDNYNAININGASCVNTIGSLRFVRIGGTSKNKENVVVSNCMLDGVKFYLNSINNTLLLGNAFNNVASEGFSQSDYPNNIWK